MFFVGVAGRSVRAASGLYETAWFRNQVPKRRVVESEAPAKRVSLVYIAPVLLFAALSVQLFSRLTIIKRGYELEVLRASVLKNDVRLRQKRLEYAFLTSPSHMGTLAHDRLEM